MNSFNDQACYLTLSLALLEKLDFGKTRHIKTKITAQKMKKSLMESSIFCALDLSENERDLSEN